MQILRSGCVWVVFFLLPQLGYFVLRCNANNSTKERRKKQLFNLIIITLNSQRSFKIIYFIGAKGFVCTQIMLCEFSACAFFSLLSLEITESQRIFFSLFTSFVDISVRFNPHVHRRSRIESIESCACVDGIRYENICQNICVCALCVHV